MNNNGLTKPNTIAVTRNTGLKLNRSNSSNKGSQKAFSIVITQTSQRQLNKQKNNTSNKSGDIFSHRRESSDDMMLNYGANIGLDRQNTQT